MIEFTLEALAAADDKATKLAKESVIKMADVEEYREVSKDMLASIKTSLQPKDRKVSEVELERLARASDEWKEFRTEQLAKIKEGLIAKVRAENARRQVETIRSGLAYRRAELERLS